MKEDKRIKYVTFIEESIKTAFGKLESGKFEDKTLMDSLTGQLMT